MAAEVGLCHPTMIQADSIVAEGQDKKHHNDHSQLACKWQDMSAQPE